VARHIERFDSAHDRECHRHRPSLRKKSPLKKRPRAWAGSLFWGT